MVHNGVINNSKEVREKHQKLDKPITYQSVLENGKFNDSEALLWDLALTLEGKQEELTVYGGIAFICIKLENNVPTTLYFGKNYGRPLKMKRDDTGMYLSSEGEGNDIDVSKLYTYDYKTRKLEDKYFKVPSYSFGCVRSFSYSYGSSKTTNSHTNHVKNACSMPSYSSSSNPMTSELEWFDICDEDDLIYDSDNNPHSPWEITFYEDGSYDVWNDNKNNWETGYWFGEQFENSKEKRGEKRFFDFIKSPSKKPAPVLKPITTNHNDVALLVLNEIGKANGYYDKAYFALEQRWADLEEEYVDVLAPMNIRKKKALLLAAMKQLEALPEYVDDTSLHPLWKIGKEQEQTSFLLTTGGK